MEITRRNLLIAIPLSTISISAKADLYDDYINSQHKQPFISFFARDNTANGHAFIAVGTELDNGLTVYEGIFGYYPSSGSKKIMRFRGSERGIVTFKESD